MNMWAKLVTALRGGISEAGEAAIDSQALRILDQEVRDSADELTQSKDGLAAIMAGQKLAEEKCIQYEQEIKKYEAYAKQALNKSDESLALEVAEKIAQMENLRQQEKRVAEDFARNANDLRSAIKISEHNIKRLKQQIDTVKATESVQRAQAAVSERYMGSATKLRTAMDSLERIKEKQAYKQAYINAASELRNELSTDSLDQKLKAAGIAPSESSAQKVLDRLKAS